MRSERTKRIALAGWRVLAVLLLLVSPAGAAPAAAQTPEYNTAFLSDQELEDYSALTAGQIRTFLAGQGSYFSQPVADVDGVIFDAAEVIAQAAAQYRINPKVILATLEKEHSGVTGSQRPSDTGMKFLMGCIKPNTAREQLACAAERFRSYHDQLASQGSSPSGWQVGVGKMTQDGVSVTPANRAVAGQFTYTPYAGREWDGNQQSVGGVYLFAAAWKKFNFGSPAPPAATAAPPTQFKANTATALVMDVSGSMSETWQGGVKIESARSAANQIVNMLDHESQIAELGGHRVGLASFSTDAMRLLDLTTDYNQARAAISGLYPLASTNLGAGIEAGNAILAQSAPGEARIMIVLSDGMTNTGLSPDQILAGPVQAAAQAGTCIYTVGFGDQNNLDSNLLQQIATASGCGQYYYAPDVSQLEQVYIRIRHQTTGNILAQFSGDVSQGEQVQAGQVDVPAGQGELAVSLHWPGSRMELILQDPNGVSVPATDPNLKIVTYANLVYALVLNPIPGAWIISVFGAEISQPAEAFDVLVSARPAPQPTPAPPTPVPTSPPPPPPKPQSGGFPVALVLLLLGGGGVFLYVYASVLKRKRVSSPAAAITGTWPGRGARLVILNGPRTGQEVALRSASISIGRGPANQVQLSDLGVSRLHAILKKGPNGWSLQDQNSKAGTYVNGQRVAATSLNNGDRIMVGSTEMLFQA